MRFIHTADLHIGKIVNEFSMLKDQAYILDKISEIAVKEKVDAVIIAGDVYDRSIPPADAVCLLDQFITTLIKAGITVCVIAGNHDSAERLNFASQILKEQKLYMSGTFDGTVKKVLLEDKNGPIQIHLLPYVKPAVVNDIYHTECKSYEDAVRTILERNPVDDGIRNILVTHHFVTNGSILPEQSESESPLSVGGADQINASCFSDYDYVALGHLHCGQKIGSSPIYYSGSPLKYSKSEVFHKKGIRLIEMNEKGHLVNQFIPLNPLHDMRCIEGTLSDLISDEVVSSIPKEDYIFATLTDELELIDPMKTLRSVYPNTMQLILKKNMLDDLETESETAIRKTKSTAELFGDFFSYTTGREMDESRNAVFQKILERLDGEENETN